jgi:hypothetical protein
LLIGAWLFGFSFVHIRRLRDLLLLGGLVGAAVVNVASYRLLAAFGGGAGALMTTHVTGTLLVSAALAAASFVSPDTSVGLGRRSVALAVSAGNLAGTSAEVCGDAATQSFRDDRRRHASPWSHGGCTPSARRWPGGCRSGAAKRAFAVSRGAIIDLSEEAPTAAHVAPGFRRLMRRRPPLHTASDTARLGRKGVEVEVFSG